MNRVSLFLFFVALSLTAKGQKDYTEAIKQGDYEFSQRHYKIAMLKYFAAQGFKPEMVNEVKSKVMKVLDAMEGEKKRANNAEATARKAKDKVVSTLKRVNSFTNKLFYPNRFYATYDSTNNYYFVDINLERVEKLGVWNYAKQFDERGWASVVSDTIDKYFTTSTHYLLDTTGKYFKVAYAVNELDHTVQILDLYKQKIDSLPAEVLTNENLFILGLPKPKEFYFPLMKVKYGNDSTLIGFFDEIKFRLYEQCTGELLSSDKNIGSMFKADEKDINTKCPQKISSPASNISFATGTTKILSKSFKALNQLAAMINSNPAIKIEIEGHTDNIGNPEKNLALSLQRALAVKYYLVTQKGVDWQRISTSGFGSDHPIAPNSTAAGRTKNSRIEIRFKNY